jgi:hypothetical protein
MGRTFSPPSGQRPISSDNYGDAFIVRVWLEGREVEGAPSEWRGMIQHVASGERRYINDLNQIKHFVRSHLEKLGVKFPGLDNQWP